MTLGAGAETHWLTFPSTYTVLQCLRDSWENGGYFVIASLTLSWCPPTIQLLNTCLVGIMTLEGRMVLFDLAKPPQWGMSGKPPPAKHHGKLPVFGSRPHPWKAPLILTGPLCFRVEEQAQVSRYGSYRFGYYILKG